MPCLNKIHYNITKVNFLMADFMAFIRINPTEAEDYKTVWLEDKKFSRSSVIISKKKEGTEFLVFNEGELDPILSGNTPNLSMTKAIEMFWYPESILYSTPLHQDSNGSIATKQKTH